MNQTQIARLAAEFEPYHAAHGGNVVKNLEAWGAERGLSEDVLDRIWAHLGATLITDTACLDPHVMEYWYGKEPGGSA